MWQKISFIIPVLNEAESIEAFLLNLQPFRERGHEIVLVDGQSEDNTRELAKPWVDRMITSGRGRARQQSLGAKMATGQVFLFLHADTRLPAQADDYVLLSLYNQYEWGRFDVRLSGRHWMFRVIEWFMNQRSCLTGIATGDQAIYLSKNLYKQVGGIPLISLMEDIEFSKRLKKLTAPDCLHIKATTSSRRWEKNGIFKTILLMWSLRLQYFFGVKPEVLQKKYYG
jgi:rSAM/selenodomain-associated transferase 2